jgi:hypothetical protein
MELSYFNKLTKNSRAQLTDAASSAGIYVVVAKTSIEESR